MERALKGRFFSHEFPTDSTGIVLNETAVRVLGLINLNGEAGSYLSIRYEPGKSEQVTSMAILGLLGLASFMAQRRTREIAIRKVSGAGVVQIIRLLNWKFIKWVLISFVLACPVAWWVMNRWLQDFVYRISLSAWIFILSVTIALALVIITVSMVTLRAASVNPDESMKYE